MDFFTMLALAAMLATGLFLILGINSMVRGGEYERAHATQYMALRVGAQGVAIVLLLLGLFFASL